MKTIAGPNQTALAASIIHPRDFLELTVRDRTTGADVIERLWSGMTNISATVLDPDTGSELTATWLGVSGLVSMDVVPRVSQMVIQEVRITMEGVGPDIDRIIQTYEPRLANVRAWRGWMNPATLGLFAPAEPRFLGFVDEVERPRAADGAEAQVVLVCKSYSMEATRTNSDTRSDESQRNRDPTDNFYKDVDMMTRRVFKL